MDEKAKQKIVKLLALANDASDEESMSALAKAQELMLQHNIDEEDVFSYKQEQKTETVINTIIYEGRPQKWQLKQDYLEGYLRGLNETFKKQVLTNGYELALQVPEVVETVVEKIGLGPGKDTSHNVKNREAFYSGYADGVRFTEKERLTV